MTAAQHCTKCGAVLRDGAPFCPACGTRVDADQPPQAAYVAPVAAPARRSNAFYLMVGSGVTVIGVVLALLLLGGGSSGGGSSTQASSNNIGGSSGQPQTGTTPIAQSTPRPTATVAPAATPAPVRPAFDVARAEQLSADVLNGAARIRGPGAETVRKLDRANLVVFSANFDASPRPECAAVAQHVKDLSTGRKGGAGTTYYRRDQGPGAGVPGNTGGVGTYGENASAEVHVYENAAQATAHLDRVRAMIGRGDFLNCERAQSTTPYTVVATTLPAGPGGVTYGHDESYNTTRGRVSYRMEEYAWQVDNLLIRVTFAGAPGTFLTPERVRDNLGAISDAVKAVGGR